MDYKELSAIDTSGIPAIDPGLIWIFGAIGVVISVLVCLLILSATWRIFTKAGRPGWYALIPVYNVYVMLQIVKKPTWLTLLFFIPYLQLIPQIIISIELGKAFGKSAAFSTIFILILPLGYFIIAFDDSKYLYGVNSNAPKDPLGPPPVTPPNAYV